MIYVDMSSSESV